MKQTWEIKTLGEVCEIIAGQSPEGKHYNENKIGTPFYQGKKEFGENELGNPTVWTNVVTKESEYGDILMSVRAPVGAINFNKIGKICIGRGLAAIRIKDMNILCNDFVFDYLLSIEIKGKEGAVFPTINKAEISSIKIPIPPLPEQQRIVEVLDREFERIGMIRRNAEDGLKYAKDLMQAKLKEELQLKEGWERKKLGELCLSIVDCPHTTPKKSEQKTNFPCIRTSELKDGFIDWTSMQYIEEPEYLKRIARLAPRENDIVYAREGTIGGAVLLPNKYKFSLGQRTMLLRPNPEIINPQYLLDFIISDSFRKQVKEKTSQGGVLHINVKDVKLLEIYFPSLPEQQQIVARLGRYSESCRKIEENCKEIIAHCDALKQALLRKAFEGDI